MAQAILLQDVENVGSRGEVIDVSSGYLRNFLLPRKLAHAATPGALAEAKRQMEAAEQAARDAANRAQENAALLSRTVLTIPQAAGEDGRLFGSVTADDIAGAIKQARGLKIDRRKVHLEQPIRTTGTHMVTIEVHDGVTADVKTIVTPEA
jgi:large subunit ribosomal protein L9